MRHTALAVLIVGLATAGCAADASAPATGTESTGVASFEAGTANVAGPNRNYIAQLGPEEEVQPAPVVSQATGVASFHLLPDGSGIRFKVNAAGLSEVLFAHLHRAAAGANGPVVVTLRADRVSGPQNGRYADGIITAAQLSGPLAGQPLSSLVAALDAGLIYVNVHSATFPAGELRGQVR